MLIRQKSLVMVVIAVATLFGSRQANAALVDWVGEVGSGTPAAFSDTNVTPLPKTANIGSLSGAITYEFIVNVNNIGSSSALMGVNPGQAIKFEQWNNTNRYGVTVFGVADHNFGVLNTYGTDVHLAFVADGGSTTKLFVNGVDTGATVPASTSLSGTVGIGAAFRTSNSTFFDVMSGSMSGVATYNSALSASEIAQHSNAFFAPPGPVTHEVGGDGVIDTETLTGTQGNETFGGAPAGRFVQVKNNGTANRRMDIGELEVFAVGDTPTVDNAGDNQWLNPSIDLAYETAGASVYAKTTNQPHGSDDDDRLLDAKETDGADVWSSEGVGNFVTVDLGATFDIGTVRVHQRNGCCQDRLRDFSVNIFADNAGTPGALLASESYPAQPANERFGELSSFAALTSADLTASLTPYDFGAGYTYVFELGSADMIEVDDPDGPGGVFTTILDLNDAAIEIEWLSGVAPVGLAGGDIFELFSADVIQGSLHDFGNTILPTLPSGMTWQNDLEVDGTLTVVNAIPEPMTMLAVGLGITGLGGYIRRRRKA